MNIRFWCINRQQQEIGGKLVVNIATKICIFKQYFITRIGYFMYPKMH